VDATDPLWTPPQNGAANRGTKVPLTLGLDGVLMALARQAATWANVGDPWAKTGGTTAGAARPVWCNGWFDQVIYAVRPSPLVQSAS
jgi:hypothetical protein